MNNWAYSRSSPQRHQKSIHNVTLHWSCCPVNQTKMSTLHEETKAEHEKNLFLKSTVTMRLHVCVLPPPQQTQQHWLRWWVKVLPSIQTGHKRSVGRETLQRWPSRWWRKKFMFDYYLNTRVKCVPTSRNASMLSTGCNMMNSRKTYKLNVDTTKGPEESTNKFTI